MRELVLFLARSLVEHPDEVEVQEIEEPDALVYELKVAESDLGRVIGRQGRTAKALRTVLSAASAKMRRRAILEILE
ncbi:MAG TPA: KH domain-containing protein [Polyangia bacterium]